MTGLRVTRDLAEEPGRPLGKEALGEWQTDEERRNLGARGGRGGDMSVAAAAAAVRGGPAGGETPRHQAASSRPGQCRGGSLGLAKLLTA